MNPERFKRILISIHALREEGDLHDWAENTGQIISIHALREEGDSHGILLRRSPSDFNPRPPRGGRPLPQWRCSALWSKFQSTPSARRATLRQAFQVQKYFISIHALREEGDVFFVRVFDIANYFNPRPPRGGRRRPICALFGALVISIHALREEGDNAQQTHHKHNVNFNPRPPRGGRPNLW